MSVINQMLRDLDARGQGDAASRRAALAAVGDTAVARSHGATSSRRWWPAAAFAVALVAVVVGMALDRWRSLDTESPAPEPLPGVSAHPRGAEPSAIDPEPTPEAPVVAAAPTAAMPSLSAAAPAEPAPTRPATPPPAEPAPAARASIERVAPSADPLAEARSALAEGRAEDALSALAAQPEAGAERDALEAAALQQLGRHAESGQAYRRALQQAPDVGAWWAGLGISLDAEGRGAEALAAFREAQRRGPLDPALADYLGERVEALSAGETPR